MILEAKNIQKSFGKTTVLKKVSLQIERGKSYAIMGSSGEGKTTLLHILGTLESFSAGSLTILGKTKYNAQELRAKHFGFIFQSYNLLDDFSLLENVLMPIHITRGSVKEKKEKALYLIEKVGLIERKDTKTKLLSGGEKQRATIARALIHDPDVIFADEPTGNLDHSNSEIVHNLLLSIKDLEKSLVLVTHDKELAMLCDEKYILKDGFLHPFS